MPTDYTMWSVKPVKLICTKLFTQHGCRFTTITGAHVLSYTQKMLNI